MIRKGCAESWVKVNRGGRGRGGKIRKGGETIREKEKILINYKTLLALRCSLTNQSKVEFNMQ